MCSHHLLRLLCFMEEANGELNNSLRYHFDKIRGYIFLSDYCYICFTAHWALSGTTRVSQYYYYYYYYKRQIYAAVSNKASKTAYIN